MQKKEYWTDRLTPQKLCAVFFIQLNEGYQIHVILPFIVFMIRDFGFGETVVGLYAGLLIATFALCQFISSYFWGYLSSLYGRKISLLTGSIFSGFAIIIFGTSTTYIQAVVARCIAGIFNGNIGVARAYVADITNGSNRAFAFSTFAIAFSAGMILGSLCGGALMQTWDSDDNGTHYKKAESILQFGIFRTQFAYLPPCVIGCIISITSFILTFIYIKDVGVEVYDVPLDELEKDEPDQCSKSLPLYSIDGLAATATTPTGTHSHYSHYRENETNSLIDLENMAWGTAATSIIDCHAMSTNALHAGIESIKSYKAEKGKLLSSEDIDSLKSLFDKTPIIHALITNVALMFMLVTWNEMVPLLLTQSLHLDALSIGVYSAYNGVILFIFTWYIQPMLLKTFKLKTLYIGFGIAMLVILISFPSIALIPNIIEWNVMSIVALTSFIGAFKFAFSTSLFVVSLVFVNNSVPPQAMGRANGLTQAFGSGLRGVGPLIGGALWSWSVTMHNPFTVYIVYGFMWISTAYSVIHCYCFIQKDIQKTWTERFNN